MIDRSKIRFKVQNMARKLNAEYCISRAGVPHIIVKGEREKISLVYVARSKQWKAFFPYPYPADKQERVYFTDEKDMFDFLLCKGAKI